MKNKLILFATAYVPLVDGFGLNSNSSGNATGLGAFFNQAFTLFIGLLGIFAVLLIIAGGLQYVSTDAWGSKDSGKKKIQAALGGLAIALLSYVILNTIDPGLTEFNFTVKPIEGLRSAQGALTVDGIPTDAQEYHDNPGGVSPINNYGSIGNITSGGNTTTEDCSSLPDFVSRGRVSVRDNIGNQGTVSPQIAWLASIVPKKWPSLYPSSTYRSAERNSQVGGSATSRHLAGEAIDFFGSGIGGPDANALVAWARQDVCGIGISQVIYQKTGYNKSGSTFNATGHDDHVHIGR